MFWVPYKEINGATSEIPNIWIKAYLTWENKYGLKMMVVNIKWTLTQKLFLSNLSVLSHFIITNIWLFEGEGLLRVHCRKQFYSFLHTTFLLHLILSSQWISVEGVVGIFSQFSLSLLRFTIRKYHSYIK